MNISVLIFSNKPSAAYHYNLQIVDYICILISFTTTKAETLLPILHIWTYSKTMIQKHTKIWTSSFILHQSSQFTVHRQMDYFCALTATAVNHINSFLAQSVLQCSPTCSYLWTCTEGPPRVREDMKSAPSQSKSEKVHNVTCLLLVLFAARLFSGIILKSFNL